jgi:putative hemolysin
LDLPSSAPTFLTFLGLLAIGALILVNAYFVASEFALVAVRRSQVKLWLDERRPGAASVARAIENLDDAIAATQLGITLASIGLGFLGEPILARLIDPLLAALGFQSFVALHGVALALSFAIVTFLHVVVGELAPKALALDRPGDVALVCARPLLLFSRIFRPVIRVMNGAGNMLVRGIGVEPAGHGGRVHSSRELELLVTESHEAGAIGHYAARMLGNVFRISGKRVRDVMVPRERICAIPRSIERSALLELLRREGYSRLPVHDGALDQVVGILHAKDVLFTPPESVNLDTVLRPFIEMPPKLSVSGALLRFRREHVHMAIVREPGGPVLGLATLENVLEEIVGEIEDEHDEDVEPLAQQRRERTAAGHARRRR